MPRIAEIPEVPDDLTGVEPPHEHLGPRAERERVQPGVRRGVGVGGGLDDEQGMVGGGVDLGPLPGTGGPEHPLHDGQLIPLGGGPGDGVVHGHSTDEQRLEALLGEATPDQLDGTVTPPGIGRHETVGDTEVPGAQAFAGDRAEELHRQIDAHAGAVTDALGGFSAPVRDGAERFVALADDVMARHPVETGD